MANTGRPPGSPLLTPDLTKKICDMLELAIPDKYAAEANDIHEDTFHSWMRKGQAGMEGYVGFHQAVTRARANAVRNMHVRALGGGKGSSAATWFLERRLWREYGQHQRVDIGQPDALSVMNETELDEEIRAQQKRVEEYEKLRDMKRALEDKSP